MFPATVGIPSAQDIKFTPTGTIEATNVQDAIAEVAAEAGGGSAHTIQEEGTSLTQRSTLNFVGSAITASDTGAKTQVATHATLNDLASNLTATASQINTVVSNTSGTNTGDQTITLTGDVTGSGTGSFAATIANNAVSNAKLATVATATFKGRTTAGTGNVEDLTPTQATALLDAAVGDSGSGGTKGLVPAPSAGSATKFLRGDMTYQTISGGGDALTTNPLSQFAATTSSQLAGVISDETGTGALVFANSPTLVTPALGTPGSGTLTNCTGLPQAGTVGLTTADSPQFAGLNIGHASDTTITRTGAGDIAVEGNAIYRAGGTDVPVTDGGTGASSASSARTNLGIGAIGTLATLKSSLAFYILGGTTALSANAKATVISPFAMTITGWTALEITDTPVSSSVTFDVWKNTYANYQPTVANTITASAKPSISSAIKNQSSTLTGWTTSVSAGDVLIANLDSVSSAKNLLLILTGTRAE